MMCADEDAKVVWELTVKDVGCRNRKVFVRTAQTEVSAQSLRGVPRARAETFI